MSERTHSLSARVRVSGFTLIEVVVTLTVFILLTASVFGIMNAVFESSNALKENQNRKDELSALRAFLQNRFATLGESDTLATYRRDENDGLRLNGVLMLGPSQATALDISRQPNGLYQLRQGIPDPAAGIATTASSFSQELMRNQRALLWTQLLPDIRSISWKFQALSTPDWLEDWTQTANKPALIECTISLAGEDHPTVMDFAVPHLIAAPNQNGVALNHAP